MWITKLNFAFPIWMRPFLSTTNFYFFFFFAGGAICLFVTIDYQYVWEFPLWTWSWKTSNAYRTFLPHTKVSLSVLFPVLAGVMLEGEDFSKREIISSTRLSNFLILSSYWLQLTELDTPLELTMNEFGDMILVPD